MVTEAHNPDSLKQLEQNLHHLRVETEAHEAKEKAELKAVEPVKPQEPSQNLKFQKSTDLRLLMEVMMTQNGQRQMLIKKK